MSGKELATQAVALDRMVLPGMSPDLAHFAEGIFYARSDIQRFGPALGQITGALIGEALALLPVLPAAGIRHDALLQWLLPITGAVRNPPAPDELKLRIPAIGSACCELPSGVFCKGAQSDAMRQWVWWPAAADVYELVTKFSAKELGVLAAIRHIAKMRLPQDDPDWKRMNEARDRVIDRDRVRRMVEAFRADHSPPETPVRAGTQLTPEQIAEVRKRSGLYPHLAERVIKAVTEDRWDSEVV